MYLQNYLIHLSCPNDGAAKTSKKMNTIFDSYKINKPTKKAIFDSKMVGLLRKYGRDEQISLTFSESGKYYLESNIWSFYLGQYSNREKVFEFLRIYDKILSFAGDMVIVEMAIFEYFNRKSRPVFDWEHYLNNNQNEA